VSPVTEERWFAWQLDAWLGQSHLALQAQIGIEIEAQARREAAAAGVRHWGASIAALQAELEVHAGLARMHRDCYLAASARR
jgi:hypothetical protein